MLLRHALAALLELALTRLHLRAATHARQHDGEQDDEDERDTTIAMIAPVDIGPPFLQMGLP